MSIPDDLMKKYFENLTRLAESEIGALLKGHPRDAKLRLASEIVSDFHSKEIAKAEQERFISEISEGQFPKIEPRFLFLNGSRYRLSQNSFLKWTEFHQPKPSDYWLRGAAPSPIQKKEVLKRSIKNSM